MAVEQIYLDNHATTPIDPRVLESMMPYLTTQYANPSGTNIRNREIKVAIEHARDEISETINTIAENTFFTSSATESINWSLRCLAENLPLHKRHIITTNIEHSAVLQTCNFLERNFNFKVTRAPVSKDGTITLSEIIKYIRPETFMVAIMHANNEIGTIQPVRDIGEYCANNNIYFMVDAAQSFGKIGIDCSAMHIDMLCGSSHKIYGPKGIGFLALSEKAKAVISPMIYGGGQEHGFRSGTENVPSIVGFGTASRICRECMASEAERICGLRNDFLSIIKKGVSGVVVNGSLTERLPGNLNFSFPGISSDLFLNNIENVIFSKGSACNNQKKTRSHVLQAITTDNDVIDGAVRIGVGRFNTAQEIAIAAEIFLLVAKEIYSAN